MLYPKELNQSWVFRYQRDERLRLKLVSLRCPHCNGELEVDDQREIFFCQYCGSKLILEEAIEASSKVKLRLIEARHEEKMQETRLEHERFKHKYALGVGLLDYLFSHAVPVALILFAVFAFLVPSCTHGMHLASLNRIEHEVEEAIKNQDYDEALVKANQLRLDDDYSYSERDSWDEKRERYIELIEDLKRQSDLDNPDMVFAPKSSADMKRLTGEEAYDLFTKAGFTNVELSEISGSAGFLKKAHSVDHVVFNGKTEFTTNDYCLKGTRITIFYYSD